MTERTDYKTLAIGVVIYMAGVFATGLIALLVLGADVAESYAFDFTVSALIAVCAGFVVRYRTAQRSRNYSVILALVLLAFHLIVTIADLIHPDGDPLFVNLAYDATVSLSIVLGGICADKRQREQPRE